MFDNTARLGGEDGGEKYLVYKHTSPTGLIYIGITNRTAEQRWNNGNGYYCNKRFYKDIKKYGWNNFKHEILIEGLTKDEALSQEKQLIEEYRSSDPRHGYNILPDGYYTKETFDNVDPQYKNTWRLDEEWRLVDGTDDYYVSSRGRMKRGKRLKKIKVDPEGYCRCYIGNKKPRVHRLVAAAFIPNPDNLPVVDHIDGDKTNNNVENLRWCTVQENTQAAYDLGLNSGSKVSSILVLDPNDEAYLYDNQIAASRATGISKMGISKIVRGVETQRKGYRFFRCNDIHDYREKV